MTKCKLKFWIIGLSLIAFSPATARATELNLFCTNQSNPALNPEGDGVMVRATFGKTITEFHAVHKVSGQLYDRTFQYQILSLNQDSNGFPSYFWQGLMIKDPNVVMTGHLWQNANIWIYDEHQVFKDGRPPKLATPPLMCQAAVAEAAPVPAMPRNSALNNAPASAPAPPAPAPPPVLSGNSVPATGQSGGPGFAAIAADTGCQSKYSDEKKADLFESRYKDKEMILTGEVADVSGGEIMLKLLRSTITFDLMVKLSDPKSAYNVEKGRRVTLSFIMRTAGGCIMSYMGDQGMFVQ